MTLSHITSSAIAAVAAPYLAVARANDVWALPDWDPAFSALSDDAQKDFARKLNCMQTIHVAKNKTQAARILAANYSAHRGYSRARLLAQYYEFTGSGTQHYHPWDWRIVLDRAMAGKAFWATQAEALPPEFIAFVSKLRGPNKKAFSPAWRLLVRLWENGCDEKGKPVEIPGYGTWQAWWKRTRPGQPLPAVVPLPAGWSEDNLCKRTRRTKAERDAETQGEAAARKSLPKICTNTTTTLFLQRVQFDDVKTDWRVFDPDTKQVCDLWLLVAMDLASRVILGFWMRPALAREDGKQDHLKLQDMKLFCGWILEKYGLPADYSCTWVVENATASLSDAAAAALGGLFGSRLNVSFTRMNGGTSGAGYRERATGNSTGKAQLESSFRLLHNEGGNIPGQTGNKYEVRPADLQAREKEAVAIWEDYKEAGVDVSKAQFPVLTLVKARAALYQIFNRNNSRINHRLEGFENVPEWRLTEMDAWQSLETFPHPTPDHYLTRTRKHSPYERAAQLIQGQRWERVPPATLVAFYENTQIFVTIRPNGEAGFQHQGQSYIFRRPEGDTHPYVEGERYLAYFAPQDPTILHLTRLAPHHGYVAAWIRRTGIAPGDREGLADQMRYVETAVRNVREKVAASAEFERQDLADMRQHNEAVLAEARANRTAIDATAPQLDAVATVRDGEVARGIATTKRLAGQARAKAAGQKKTTEDLRDAADEAMSAFL